MADLTPVQNLREFREIQKFTAACRRLWPGAKIALRPHLEFAHQRETAPTDFGTTTTETSDDQ